MATPAFDVNGVRVPITGDVLLRGPVRATPLPAGSQAAYLIDVGAVTASDDETGGAVALHGSTHEEGGGDQLDLDSVAGVLDAGKLFGSALLDEVVATVAVKAGVFGAYSDPTFDDFPTVSFEGGVAGVAFGTGGGAVDARVGRLAAGVMGAQLGVLRAGELGASGQEAAFFRNADNLNAGTVDLERGGTGADGSTLAAGLVLASLAVGVGAASYRSLVETDIPSLPASKIGSGNLAFARLPAGGGTWAVSGTLTIDSQIQPASVNTTGAVTGLALIPSVGGSLAAGRIVRRADLGMVLYGAAGSSRCVAILNDLGNSVLTVEPGSTTLRTDAKHYVGGELEIDGALNHDGATAGVFGVAPANRVAARTITNDASNRTLDVSTATLPQLANFVATMARDLITYGWFQ
jgi:hypothetical protein